ncbi:hypothetical protein GCM10023093_29450 [Nemorincola caseinilytica]|uniref:Trehalose-6-phosphate synthase n=1 Tax=Nemorincola caseinilytica TaxID=2054315 RepID=A0ABP8NPI5_9BACT
MEQKRIINVSNRLPVKLCRVADELILQQSEGGLATGLSSVFNNYCSQWIGWPGAVVVPEHQNSTTMELNERNLTPVYLSEEEIANFYEGFSNDTLWPLFHYFPSYSNYNEQYWRSYVAVNKKFADAVVNVARPGDMVWVHDYQLMLVPSMVRAMAPDITIGYFQHIPFPDYEIFRALPWKAELLKGLLGADIIGFQTKADVRHFLSTVRTVLSMTPNGNKELVMGGRKIVIEAFPISIDHKKFHDLAKEKATDEHVQKVKAMGDTKIMLSIDRLDYSKGILQRLQAYELFLKKHPEWRQKVTLVHLIVPSRDNVPNYKKLKEEMNRQISQINGTYSVFGWQPIQHFYQSFEPHMLAALYKIADVAIVTPLRDGMNLVSKEYVACNVDQNGVLLLSEAAGAAAELTDAILLNPNDTKDFANKIYEGLTMPAKEKKERMQRMQQVVAEADIFQWAERFNERMTETDNEKKRPQQTSISFKQKDNTVVFPNNIPLAS